MSEEEVKLLLEKYAAGECTEAEKAQLEIWYAQLDNEVDLSAERIAELKEDLRNKLPGKSRKRTIRLWAAAASTVAAVMVTGIGIWLAWPQESPVLNSKASDIPPGGNRATLTLSNGQTIPLSDHKKGIVILAANLAYDDGTKIAQQDLTGIQTIATPKGGEYEIVLSDGTKVWLNAASTLLYPATFREQGSRRVELRSGEAYFQVAKDRKRPFVVSTGHQEVLVLGTHFNINAYEIGTEIRTTLEEGSVAVQHKDKSRQLILKPGEQAIQRIDNIFVRQADLDVELAWKNGKIEFIDADIKSIMRTLEQWYNIEVVYLGKPKETTFTGSVSRNKNISEILKLLESTGDVHFKIEGRRIKVLTN